MRAALGEWLELANIIAKLMVVLAAVGLVFAVPIGVIVLVVRLVLSLTGF